MSELKSVPNADLQIVEGNKGHWTHADHRREGWHKLYRIARYGMSFRAAHVMTLDKRMSLEIAELECVRQLTALPWFSAILVMRDQHILFERYAGDFGPRCPHSIQSITKTIINLVMGELVENGIVDLSRPVIDYIPEIGSGYADATIQQVLDMDVVNEYSEDYADPKSAYYSHEEAMGWRLPRDPANELTEHAFLTGIASADTVNRTGYTHYKDANTAVLGWVAERASGRPLRSFLADIVDAAGLEDTFYITADRNGVPTLEGGASLTARDLGRYFSLFVRRGRGVDGKQVGSGEFIEKSLCRGVPMRQAYEGFRYSNHLMISGRRVSHTGWGGQCAIADLDTGAVGVLFSVLENQHASSSNYPTTMFRALGAALDVAASLS